MTLGRPDYFGVQWHVVGTMWLHVPVGGVKVTEVGKLGGWGALDVRLLICFVWCGGGGHISCSVWGLVVMVLSPFSLVYYIGVTMSSYIFSSHTFLYTHYFRSWGVLYVTCVVNVCSFMGNDVSGLCRVHFLPGFPGSDRTWCW